MINLLLASILSVSTIPVETDYWSLEHFTSPDGAILEVGGMDFLPDGRLVVSTRRGQVWIVENALSDDPADAVFHLAAEGLHEGLGLKVVGNDVLIVQRGELSRLQDLDENGDFETIETITQDWGMTGNYHEFAFGLPRDEEGNVYVSLNVGFWNPDWWHGRSRAPYRGWLLRIAPDGSITPVASGFRSPCGIGIDHEGRLLVTENQGDWMAVCPILHVRDGDFFGHPASLQWEKNTPSDTELSTTQPPDVERTPAAIWIPYAWSRSTGNLEPDTTGGAFGPFNEQLFVAELTNGMILRAQLETVDGVTQGACFKFMQRIGSASRVLFAPDGSLIVGFTNRGWGGYPPGHGLARIRFKDTVPMEIDRVRIQPDGFEIDFTMPLHGDMNPDMVHLTAYDYNWWWEYGSPEQNVHEVPVTSTSLSEDRQTLTIRAPIEAGWCIRMRLEDVEGEGGVPLLHDEVSYTINRVPGAGIPDKKIAVQVEPPASRDDREAGWMRLTWGDVFEQWESDGWVLGESELDMTDRTRFSTRPGNSAIVNSGDSPSDFVSRGTWGDMQFQLKFMLPERGASSIQILEGPIIELRDNSHLPGYPTTCGALIATDGTRHKPMTNAYQGAGLWHELQATIRAPRTDSRGNVVEPAKAERIAIDGTLIHQNVPLGMNTSSRGPLTVIGDAGLVGLADVRIKPLDVAWDDDSTWNSILPKPGLVGWQPIDDSSKHTWKVVDETLNGHGTGGLFMEQTVPQDFALQTLLRINEGGEAAIIVNASKKDGRIEGIHATINNSVADAPRTGSLGTRPVRTDLLAPISTFQYRLEYRQRDGGIQLKAFVNGIPVNEWTLDDAPDQSHHIGLVLLNPHTELQVHALEVRPLEP